MHVEDTALTFQKKSPGSRNVARTGREERERDTVSIKTHLKAQFVGFSNFSKQTTAHIFIMRSVMPMAVMSH